MEDVNDVGLGEGPGGGAAGKDAWAGAERAWGGGRCGRGPGDGFWRGRSGMLGGGESVFSAGCWREGGERDWHVEVGFSLGGQKKAMLGRVGGFWAGVKNGE